MPQRLNNPNIATPWYCLWGSASTDLTQTVGDDQPAELPPGMITRDTQGLLIGIEVDFPAVESMPYFQKEGILICIAGPQVIRFIPPLIVTKADIDRVIDTLERFLGEKTGC